MAASVLIIDAEEDFANHLAAALREQGIEPAVTGDGKVGLDLARINIPSAIVLCVELPRMSGYSICAKVKKDITLSAVPLIITSSEATPETFEHHKKLKTRAEEYLKKPFTPEHLIEVLRQYVPLAMDAPSGEEIPISEELQIEDAPPATLSDDEAFSEQEAISMDGGGHGGDPFGSADLNVIDEVLAGLTQPVPAEGQMHNALSQGAGMTSHADVDPEDEVMTSVGFAPPHASSTELLRYEIADLKGQLQAARDAQFKAERERNLAVANERAAASSAPASVPGAPSAVGRDVLTLKRELNQKEHEILELKDKLHAKERELLQQRDREMELEGEVVQAGEAATAAEGARLAAEADTRAATERASVADSKAVNAEAKATAAERRAASAEAQAEAADERAQAADSRASEAEGAATLAEGRADAAEARASQAEMRTADAERTHAEVLQDLNRRLGDEAAHAAELEATIQSMADEAASLRETIAERDQTANAAQAQIQALRTTNQTQTQEITRLSNELSAATAEAESLREQLSDSQAMIEELHHRIVTLDNEFAVARGEGESLRTNIEELEQERQLSENRMARAYQKLRDDEKIRGKARKAIEIALALLQEAGYAPEAEPVQEAAEVPVDEARS